MQPLPCPWCVHCRRQQRELGGTRDHPQGGFTLVELLVVIAVLTLLMGILFPVFTAAREAARRSNCLSNLRQIAVAHRMYVEDHEEMLPFWWMNGPHGAVIWPEYLRPYYRSAQILDQHFYSPSEQASMGWLADYVLCAWGPFGDNTLEHPYWRNPGAVFWNRATGQPHQLTMSQVRRPAETMQFMDGVTGRSSGSAIGGGHHDGVLNGAFLDGHAQRINDGLWNRVDHDEQGYFYHINAADR
jgi:prepilin-type N-terminal cleavage/methylation domain-containing protein/prepilin-type processing-associated H-X9-DG protein